MNCFKCGMCGYFDGIGCTLTGMSRDEDEIVRECESFEYSIYYESC